MSPAERRAAGSLAAIFMLRMLGLFMVLPVFMLHAAHYEGYTPFLAGIAIGAYGLTQALLQIPFGLASDRFGRRPIILIGLTLFALGSVLAALAESMVVVIMGRALQGAGAIAAATLALAADLTREEHRTKTMAVIGVSIGLSFAVAMVLGPAIAANYGLAGVFWGTAALAVGGILVLMSLVPRAKEQRFHRDTQPIPSQIGSVLRDGQLLRLDGGIFILHLVMTATFVALPPLLSNTAGLAIAAHWKFYLASLLLAILIMVPFVRLADKRGQHQRVFLGAISILAVAQLGLALNASTVLVIGVFTVAYFAAVNVLEASLPSLVSRIAPGDKKGTALGVYSTSQFLGAFCGGALGGWLLQQYGLNAVFALGTAAVLLWLLVAVGQRDPGQLSTRLLPVGTMTAAEAHALGKELLAVDGVAEAVVVADDGIAYLKVHRQRLDAQRLNAYKVTREDC